MGSLELMQRVPPIHLPEPQTLAKSRHHSGGREDWKSHMATRRLPSGQATRHLQNVLASATRNQRGKRSTGRTPNNENHEAPEKSGSQTRLNLIGPTKARWRDSTSNSEEGDALNVLFRNEHLLAKAQLPRSLVVLVPDYQFRLEQTQVLGRVARSDRVE